MASRDAVFAVLAVVALVSQATALQCYQAPKSWDACWTDPSGMPWDHPRSFRGDSRFMSDYTVDDTDGGGTTATAAAVGAASCGGSLCDYRTFASRKKCTIPCGGVGLMPREKVASYEIQTSCNKCTDWFACPSYPTCCLPRLLPASHPAADPVKTIMISHSNHFSQRDNAEVRVSAKDGCERLGCCTWKEGKLWGGYCGAANTGMCKRPEDNTELSVSSGIKCKDLPALGVSPWKPTAKDAGFELRECENPTDVCASYCVAVHEPDPTSSGGDQVSCSHGCLPKSVKSARGDMQAAAVLEEIFKTSLATEDNYWCSLGPACKMTLPDQIKKRDGACTDGCLYTGPANVRLKSSWGSGQAYAAGLCNDRDNKNVTGGWSCKFRVCEADACNFSAAPSSSAHIAFAAVIGGVLSLALTIAH